MLIGTYTGSLNEKRRVTVPKKILAEVGSKPVLAKWYEDCLILVSLEFWNSLIDKLSGGKRPASVGIRDIERFILGSAFELEPDELGRIVIPEILSKYANLDKEIVFIGLLDRVEIWKKDTWDQKSEQLSKTTKDYLENLK
jgi:MraZ protein